MAATHNTLGWLLLLIVHEATTEYYCPSIAPKDRSTLDPVGEIGSSVTIYQIFHTDGLANELNINWIRHPGNLSLSIGRYSITNTVLDDHTLNASITLLNAQPYPDEGVYIVTASSDCTSNTTEFYLQMYICNVTVVPQPLELCNVTVIAEVALPPELHLRITFHGVPDAGWSNTNWIHGNSDFCTENTFPPNPMIQCNRTRVAFANCTFTVDLWISKPNYTNSGIYTVNAVSTFAQPPSKNATIDLYIVPLPKISTCNTGHINVWIGSHVHLECVVTSYSDFVNVTVVENEGELHTYSARDICQCHQPDDTVATCAVDISTSQVSGSSKYKLCVGYNNSVPQRPLPLCSDNMGVTFKKRTERIMFGIGALVLALLVALPVFVIIIVLYLKKKKKVCSSDRKRDGHDEVCEENTERSPLLGAPVPANLRLPPDGVFEHGESEKDNPGSKTVRPVANQHLPSYGATVVTEHKGGHHLHSVLEPGAGYTQVQNPGDVDIPPIRRNEPCIVKRQRSKTGTHFLPKVTVIYAQNPGRYIQIAPPRTDNEERLAQYETEVVASRQRMEQNITHQKKLVKDFADFLKSLGIAVAYDQLISDCPVDNKRLWIQEQIKDSDYVIFIITPSFVQFMEESVTPDEEMIFQGQYLHNLMSNPENNKNGDKIVLVSVFLERCKVGKHIPKGLETGNIFELWTPYVKEEGRPDDLNTFCNFIMGEKGD